MSIRGKNAVSSSAPELTMPATRWDCSAPAREARAPEATASGSSLMQVLTNASGLWSANGHWSVV